MFLREDSGSFVKAALEIALKKTNTVDFAPVQTLSPQAPRLYLHSLHPLFPS